MDGGMSKLMGIVWNVFKSDSCAYCCLDYLFHSLQKQKTQHWFNHMPSAAFCKLNLIIYEIELQISYSSKSYKKFEEGPGTCIKLTGAYTHCR